MNRLLIVGAGGLGREVLCWANDIPAESRDWTVCGFLDDDRHALDGSGCPASVVGTIRDYAPSPSDVLAMGIGSPPLKMRLGRQLMRRGATFITLVHPTVVMGFGVPVGRGCVLCPHAVVTCDACLGSFVTLNLHATVGHDAQIGDGCNLGPHACVSGRARIGSEVQLGGHANVLPGVVVEDGATVGAGSVALRRVRAGSTVVGVPARSIRDAGKREEHLVHVRTQTERGEDSTR